MKLKSIKVNHFALAVATFVAASEVRALPKGVFQRTVDQIESVQGKSRSFMCAEDDAGLMVAGVFNQSSGVFKPYTVTIKNLKLQIKKSFGSKRLSLQKKLKNTQKIAKEGRILCQDVSIVDPMDPANPGNPSNPSNPGNPPSSDAPFSEFTEPLNALQVAQLFQKLAYGASNDDLNACVGKTAAECFQNRLLVCDRDADNRIWEESKKLYDENFATGEYATTGTVTQKGLQAAVAYWALNTPCQFQAKIALGLFSNHFAGEFAKLGNDAAFKRVGVAYTERLRNYAFVGDIEQTTSGMIYDPFLMIFLDNGNNTCAAPGENFPREVWELYTIGRDNLKTGEPNYDNLNDIPQWTKAFTGWTALSYVDPISKRTEVSLAYRTGLACVGQKTVFAGKPEQAVIDDIQSAVSVALKHPGFADYWAKDILDSYFVDVPDFDKHIDIIAKEIRSSNNFHAVLKKIALSKEAFGEMKKSAVKDNFDIVLGLARTFGLPMSTNVQSGKLANFQINTGCEFINSPQGPFGCTKERWVNSQLLKMAIENEITGLIADLNTQKAINFTFDKTFERLSDLEKADPLAVIRHLSERMGCQLSQAEEDALLGYMTKNITAVNASGAPTTMTDMPWDPKDPKKVALKIPGVIRYIASTLCFGTK